MLYPHLIEQVLASSEALMFPDEAVLRTINGAKKFIAGKGFAITDAREECNRIAFIVRDITKEHKAEYMLSDRHRTIMSIMDRSEPAN